MMQSKIDSIREELLEDMAYYVDSSTVLEDIVPTIEDRLYEITDGAVPVNSWEILEYVNAFGINIMSQSLPADTGNMSTVGDVFESLIRDQIEAIAYVILDDIRNGDVDTMGAFGFVECPICEHEFTRKGAICEDCLDEIVYEDHDILVDVFDGGYDDYEVIVVTNAQATPVVSVGTVPTSEYDAFMAWLDTDANVSVMDSELTFGRYRFFAQVFRAEKSDRKFTL